MSSLQFKDEPPAVIDGWYWVKHKDSDVPFIGHLIKDGSKGCTVLLLERSGELSDVNFHHYLFAGPIPLPTEQPVGLQMAVEADDNRLLTPREMLHHVSQAMDDMEDLCHTINKAIFIGLYSKDGHYRAATFRCNLSNSEAVALLTVKANEFCREISGDAEPEPEP